ncbi:MAG: ketopantoate reductase family protein [Candidatus Bathyarchaeia archaeon]
METLLSRKVDILLIGRKNHVDAINAGGLVVTGVIEGVFHVKASEELKSIPDNSLIILTKKAHDSAEALDPIRILLKGVKMLVLQNGVGDEGMVRGLINPGVEVLRGVMLQRR